MRLGQSLESWGKTLQAEGTAMGKGLVGHGGSSSRYSMEAGLVR